MKSSKSLKSINCPNKFNSSAIDEFLIIFLAAAKAKGISKVSSYGENVYIEFREEGKERMVLKSRSKDDDDIIATAMGYLKKS